MDGEFVWVESLVFFVLVLYWLIDVEKGEGRVE